MSAATTTVALTGLLFGTLIAGGCSKRQVDAVPRPPERVYVRLEPLNAAHPLQGDVERLAAAEARLRRLAAGGATASTGSASQELRLPPLAEAASEGRAVEAARADALENRLRERERLLAAFQRELDEFATGIALRQERRIEQRRAELYAVGAAREAERERRAREGVQDQILQDIRARLDRWTELLAGREVMDAQLNPDTTVTVFPPIITSETLRAKLSERRRAVQAQLDLLAAEIARIKVQGEKDLEGATAEVRARQLAEIEAKLDALREDAETAFLFRNQRSELAQVFAREEAVFNRTRTALGRGGADALNILPVGSGVASARPATAGASPAADQIAVQRAELEKLLQEDVRETVRDVAQSRNMDVLFLKEGQPPPAGRVDRTKDFSGWVRWERQPALPGTLSGGKGR